MPSPLRRLTRRHPTALVILLGLGLLVTLQALVMPGSSVSAANVVPMGRALASNCMQCHGTNGTGGGFDGLAGESVAELMEELRDQRTHRSIMGAQARGYTDDELLKIATYFSSLPKP